MSSTRSRVTPVVLEKDRAVPGQQRFWKSDAPSCPPPVTECLPLTCTPTLDIARSNPRSASAPVSRVVAALAWGGRRSYSSNPIAEAQTYVTKNSFTVTAWNNSHWHTSGAGYGLRVSVADRDRYFKRNWRTVSLRLIAGSTVIGAVANSSKESFWSGRCRELISQDIGRWIIGLDLSPWPKHRPPRFTMSPIGPAMFRVERQTAPP